ncbi:ABC transporter ATP-binding protein [Planctomycetota bacterium]|nr:ABC transporter ATP-binding protein [Planctomycetota bacterium]
MDLIFDNINVPSILHDFSVSLKSGECVVVLGPNGAGKTTLLHTALGLRKSTGKVLVGDQNLAALPPRKRASLLSYLPQDAPWLEAVSVLDAVVSARFRFNESLTESRAQALEALTRVGAENFAQRTMTSLSGGERQRIHMATVLAQDTPWLLLDEPANHLDPAQQRDICRLIKTVWESGKGVLAVIHDINALRWFESTDIKVIGIKKGKLAFDCQYGDANLEGHLSALFGLQFKRVEIDGQNLLLTRGDA